MNRESSPASSIDAILFDAYGTLLDVYSVGAAAEARFPGQGAALTAAWRQKQLEYSWLRTLGGRYKPFWEVTRDALRHSCERLGLALSPNGEAELMAQYARLSPFPECGKVLADLRGLGFRLGVLSNGDPAMLGNSFASAGLDGALDMLLSIDPVGRFKVAAQAYAVGTQALGLPAARILFVSSNAWDAVGATWFGYPAMWLNRLGMPPERLDTEPAYTGRDLNDVLRLLEGTAQGRAAPT